MAHQKAAVSYHLLLTGVWLRFEISQRQAERVPAQNVPSRLELIPVAPIAQSESTNLVEVWPGCKDDGK